MTEQSLARTVQAYPPRLMGEQEAARYLGIGKTMLRDKGPEPKRLGVRRLYDRIDLDRWADRLGDQPLEAADEAKERDAVTKQFMDRFNAPR